MPATTTRPLIRTNFGSHRRVVEVCAYDSARRLAMCKLSDGTFEHLGCDELEALDAARNYLDLDRALRDAAHEIIE